MTAGADRRRQKHPPVAPVLGQGPQEHGLERYQHPQRQTRARYLAQGGYAALGQEPYRASVHEMKNGPRPPRLETCSHNLDDILVASHFILLFQRDLFVPVVGHYMNMDTQRNMCLEKHYCQPGSHRQTPGIAVPFYPPAPSMMQF